MGGGERIGAGRAGVERTLESGEEAAEERKEAAEEGDEGT